MNNTTFKKLKISDQDMLLRVMVAVIFQIVFLTIWTAVGDIRVKTTFEKTEGKDPVQYESCDAGF